ncbi:MAG: energy-coupling factor ABC transporter ATP-binding protein [Methanoregula sp.]|nr:energy-coupling factor ABC transporter ATP-binding protein [Methanoregula sp.]
MIAIDNLRYRSIGIDALTIHSGITSIIGENGSGKTTFLKLLSGIAIPESGTILIDGKNPRESEIGWVNEFPDRNILFGTVFHEVTSSLRFRNVECRKMARAFEDRMDSLGIRNLRNRLVRELSGGEKILVALAAALVHNPGLLVLDEYDSHLDAARINRIEEILHQSGIVHIIRCTQQMETAARSDQVVHIDRGRVLLSGPPAEVFPALAQTPFYPLSWRCAR